MSVTKHGCRPHQLCLHLKMLIDVNREHKALLVLSNHVFHIVNKKYCLSKIMEWSWKLRYSLISLLLDFWTFSTVQRFKNFNEHICLRSSRYTSADSRYVVGNTKEKRQQYLKIIFSRSNILYYKSKFKKSYYLEATSYKSQYTLEDMKKQHLIPQIKILKKKSY